MVKLILIVYCRCLRELLFQAVPRGFPDFHRALIVNTCNAV